MKLKNKKGISKITATIIIISFCIIITIAAVTWISGITSIFMKNDKIEITDVWSKRSFDYYFFICIEFKNVGETTVKVCNVEINGKPFKEFAPGIELDVANARTFKILDPSNEKSFIDVRPGEFKEEC